MVKHRNLFLIYILAIITFGIYALYWLVSTKNEINSQGAEIPTAWLLIIPIANIFWFYKYCEGFSKSIKKDNNTILWFLLYCIIAIITPAIVQHELNKVASTGSTTIQRPTPQAPATPPIQTPSAP